jgi:adenosine deaminase
LERLPKTDLHVHLDGSLRPETMIELAREYGVKMPVWDADELREYMHVQDARNLVDYLARFDTTLSVMQTAEALERIAYELAEDAARENVRYMEVRYSPVLNIQGGLSLNQAVEAPLKGLRRAEQDFGIKTAVIICGLRNMSPHTSMELAELTVQQHHRGVVAFDLAGAEENNPAKKHREAFYYVVNANVAATIHAGEAYGPESIHQALHYCNANRIGHGTRLFEDPELMQYVNDFRIPLEICLTSNVQTRAVADFADHPVRLYYDEGLVVTLNTDNRLMSNTSMTSEMVGLADAFGWGIDDFEWLTVNAMKSAFSPFDERLRIINGLIKPRYALLRAEAALGAPSGA